MANELPAWAKKVIQLAVDESLNNAIENGYDEVKTDDAEAVACDMGTVDPAFEGVEVEDLAPFVRDWQARQKAKQ